MDVASRSWDTGDDDNAETFLRNRQGGGAFSKLAELMAQAEQKAEGRSHHHPKSHHHHHHQSAATVTACAECHQDFPDVAALARHQQKHHTLRKPHRCKACRQEFALLSSLQLHKCLGSPSSACQLCHGKAQRGAPCSACSTDPADAKGPRQHHHDSSPYACAPCGRAFSHKQELLYHQQAGGCQPAPLSPKAVKPSTIALASFTPAASTPTPSYASLPPSSPPLPAAGACSFCPRVFRSAAGLANHQRTWHPSQTDKNSTTTMTTTTTKLPQKSAVKMNGKTSSEKMPGAKCKQANLSDSAAKKRDTGGSGGGSGGGGGGSGKKGQVFPCRSCDRVFSQTSTLHQHRREVHQREKRAWREHRTSSKSTRQGKKGETYPCPICGKVFLHHLTRWTHLRTHSAQQQEQQQQQGQVRKPLGRPPGAKPLGRPPGVKTLGRPPGAKPLGRPPKYTKDTKTAEKHPLKKAKKSSKSGSTATKAEHKKLKTKQERRVAEKEDDEDDDDDDDDVEDEDKEEEGREFPCPSCLEVFSSPSDLHKHEEVHQPAEVTITTCCVCSGDITHAEEEEEGAATAVPELVYHCAPCRQAFSSLHTFLQHCRMHLPSDSDDGDGSETDSANEVG